MWPLLALGVILVLVGLVWALQGFDIVGGSAMSGSALWATVGPIVAVIGVALIVVSIVIARRRGRAS